MGSFLFWSIFACNIFGFHFHGDWEAMECPSKTKPTRDANTSRGSRDFDKLCEKDEYGYIYWDFGTGDQTNFCCARSDTFCEETGLHGFWVEEEGIITGEIVNMRLDAVRSVLGSKYWYKKSVLWNKRNYTIGCPIPFSYQLIDVGLQNATAVGFREDTKLRTCESSHNCEEDEFCGHAFNPAYCGNMNDTNPFIENDCLDKSNNEQALKFCFKAPELPSPYKLNRDSVGLTLCDDTSICKSVPNTVCLGMNVSNYRYISPDGTVDPVIGEYIGASKTPPHNLAGICVEAHVCDSEKHLYTFGQLGRNNNPCTIDEADSCPWIGAECISVEFDAMTYCCHPKPTTTTTTTTAQTTDTTTQTTGSASQTTDTSTQTTEATGPAAATTETTPLIIELAVQTTEPAAQTTESEAQTTESEAETTEAETTIPTITVPQVEIEREAEENFVKTNMKLFGILTSLLFLY